MFSVLLSTFRRVSCCCIAGFLVCVSVFLSQGLRGEAAEIPVREIWRGGNMTVTGIQDLPGEMSVSIFRGPASEAEKAKYFNKEGKAEAGFNVFLLRVGGKIALFDTGNGTARGRLGKLPELLAGLGIKPEDVDFVLLTHMHMDHIGGLVRENKRTFPKAKLMVAKPELAYWTELAEKSPSNENALLAKAVVVAYGPDILPPFAFGDTLLPGVTALDASGHTPGHTVFQVQAEGKNLLIIGDLIHGTPLQFALPDECATFDIDQPKAIETRKRILSLAEQKGMQIAGMHLPFPGDGKVEKDGKGWKLRQEK